MSAFWLGLAFGAIIYLVILGSVSAWHRGK